MNYDDLKILVALYVESQKHFSSMGKIMNDGYLDMERSKIINSLRSLSENSYIKGDIEKFISLSKEQQFENFDLSYDEYEGNDYFKRVSDYCFPAGLSVTKKGFDYIENDFLKVKQRSLNGYNNLIRVLKMTKKFQWHDINSNIREYFEELSEENN